MTNFGNWSESFILSKFAAEIVVESLSGARSQLNGEVAIRVGDDC